MTKGWMVLLAGLVLFSSGTMAQTASPDSAGHGGKVRVALVDGSELVGRIVSQDSLLVRFETLTRISVEIPCDRIRSVRPLDAEGEDASTMNRDPGDRGLLLGPTARGLRANEASFSVYEVFFPSVAIGIADLFTLEGGVSVFPSVSSQIIFFAPKITPGMIGNVRFALGILYVLNPSGNSSESGIVYGVATWERPEVCFTTGLGWGIGRTTIDNAPLVEVGAEVRTSAGSKLLLEFVTNSRIQNPGALFGFRWYGQSLSADFGFLRLLSERTQGFPLIPILSVSYRFGR